MAKRARFKPSAKAICNLPQLERNRYGDAHITDLRNAGRGMLPWLEKHGHIRRVRGTSSWYDYTRKGKKMMEAACNVDWGMTSSGRKRAR